MMAALATPISEEWIRERVGLNQENLCEDVKSLALPGTYHEKITSLGKSLQKFTRLKNLDLSRNSLDSIKGLENCTLLENVNLYYNNLNTLEDISPLRFNSSITNLDLRLNPVARTEADYRLFVVNILPNLKILDDRPVRESERDAASAHFNSTSKDGQPPSMQAPETKSAISSKSRIVPSGIVGGSTMDAEDRAVLTLLSNADAGPPQNTGSAGTMATVEQYHLSELKALGEQELELNGKRNLKPNTDLDDLDNRTSYYQAKYPNIPAHRLSEISIDDVAKQESEAYTSYKGQGHFTPNPDLVTAEMNSGKSRSSSGNTAADAQNGSSDNNPILISLLDLVDKYWNGSKSLHDNKKFMKLATDLQKQMVVDGCSALKSQIQRLKQENSELLESAVANEGLKRVKGKLDQTETEMNKLRSHISELQSENNKLRLSLHSHSELNAPVRTSVTSNQELEELKHENYQLQFKLKQYSQMSELAKMLQESHKSLVQTNDHLLREIEEMRNQPTKFNGHG